MTNGDRDLGKRGDVVKRVAIMALPALFAVGGFFAGYYTAPQRWTAQERLSVVDIGPGADAMSPYHVDVQVRAGWPPRYYSLTLFPGDVMDVKHGVPIQPGEQLVTPCPCLP